MPPFHTPVHCPPAKTWVGRCLTHTYEAKISIAGIERQLYKSQIVAVKIDQFAFVSKRHAPDVVTLNLAVKFRAHYSTTQRLVIPIIIKTNARREATIAP